MNWICSHCRHGDCSDCKGTIGEDTCACACNNTVAARPASPVEDLADEEKDELLDLAWGLIANAGGGNWNNEKPEWVEAAKRWRDRYVPPKKPCGYCGALKHTYPIKGCILR